MNHITDFDYTQDLSIIFGHSNIDLNKLSVDQDQLKKAYLRRALQLHPDRAVTVQKDPSLLHDGFTQLRNSYERLTAHFTKLNNPSLPLSYQRSANLPKTYLKFAQFLFHKGIISRDLIFIALEWQRKSGNLKKPIGKFFVEHNHIKSAAMNGLLIEFFNHNKHYKVS